MIYYCEMRDELKNVFGKEITLEDGSQYYYTIQPFEMKNILGAVVAVLDEYLFTKKGASETYKLYRTKDGNWYDISNGITEQNTILLRYLKQAISSKESVSKTD